MSLNNDTWFGNEVDTLENLERAHLNRRIIEFALFARELPAYAQGAGQTSAHMTLSYQAAKHLSPGVLANIVAEPQFHYWTVHALHLLRRLKACEEVPSKDTPHLEGVPGFERDPLGVHVKDLGRFLLAAELRSGEAFETVVPLHNSELHLPGLNMVIRVVESAPEAVIAVSSGGRAMTVNGHAVEDFEAAMASALSQKAGFTSRQVTVLPFVRRGAGSFAVNAVEPYWARTWVSNYRNPDGSGYHKIPVETHDLWAIELAKAMDLISDCWPQMEADVARLLRAVVPVRSPQADVHMSCSSDVFRFAVLMSEGAPEALAEAFIHEFGHNLLNIFIEEGEVFEGSPPQREILYSPWRPDARHFTGVLHAAFVFERVCEFYRRYLERKQNRLIRARYALMAGRLCLANEVLAGSDANLTQSGTGLIKQIQARMQRHAEASGFLRDECTRMKLREHYEAWEVRNPSAHRPTGEYVSQLLRT